MEFLLPSMKSLFQIQATKVKVPVPALNAWADGRSHQANDIKRVSAVTEAYRETSRRWPMTAGLHSRPAEMAARKHQLGEGFWEEAMCEAHLQRPWALPGWRRLKGILAGSTGKAGSAGAPAHSSAVPAPRLPFFVCRKSNFSPAAPVSKG